MLTVKESVERLKGFKTRERIYKYMEKCWIEDSYVPSLRNIARTLFIPFSTVVFNVNKLIDADLLYRIDDTDAVVIRGSTTNIDIQAMCKPIESAYWKPGGRKGAKKKQKQEA